MHIVCASVMNLDHAGGPGPQCAKTPTAEGHEVRIFKSVIHDSPRKNNKNVKIKTATAPNVRFPKPSPYWIHRCGVNHATWAAIFETSQGHRALLSRVLAGLWSGSVVLGQAKLSLKLEFR